MKLKYKWFILIGLLFFIFNCSKTGTNPQPKPRPRITKQPEVQNIQTTSAVINWETDVVANSTIRYGTTSGSYPLAEKKGLEEKNHTIALRQLQSNTVYYFIAESKNSGGSVSSDENQFSTLKTLDQLNQFAWENYQNGNFLEAISAFKEILSQQSNSADAYNGLGWCYIANEVDSLRRALVNFELANQNQSNFVEALAGRGFVRLALKQYSSAVQDLGAAIGINPNFVFSYNQKIDANDIRLGLAEANFFRHNYDLAQEQVDILEPNNGMNSTQQNTWIVDNIAFNSYPEALLAWIEKLKAIV